MKLFMVPAAPNPTKVMLYIAERETVGPALGIEQVVVNTLKGRHREPEHLARNPFGTLPVLELDDGRHLIESLSIIRYLEDKFPAHSMLGHLDTEARAIAWELERVVELRVSSAMARYVHATNSPLGLAPDPKVAKEIEASLPVVFDYLEDLLADGRPFLGGDDVTPADCTLQAGCQFVRFGKGDLLGERALLTAWDERYRARDAAQAVLKF